MTVIVKLHRCLIPFVLASHSDQVPEYFGIFIFVLLNYNCVECGGSVVECRTRNRESTDLNPPFATLSKYVHFRSSHDASDSTQQYE